MGVKLPSVETVFGEAIEIVSATERAAYLDRACGGDADLRRRVESLLDAHLRAGSFLDATGEAPIGARDAPTSPAEGPGEVIGPYKLLEEIGEGGMGVVYMAEQAHPIRRRVALKVIKPGMDSRQVIARFEAERQALALMDHPNIARVHDAGTTRSGRPYFVMELVRGLPITEYCDREQLSIPERLELFVQVCRAVQHAHQKGIIHRDLKPSNVLVTVVDGVPVPKVIDFGVAKATGGGLTDRTLFTGFQQLVGTPLYMSPEQADLSGMDIDTRSDIYSLGVLLYELLTGTTPFDQETFRQAAFDEIRRMIREDEPPRPSTRLSSLGETRATISANRKSDVRHLERAVHGELDWIVMKALEKDRRRRYDTANNLAADLMRHLNDQPVEACPPSVGYLMKKFAHRNRGALSATAVILSVLVVLCGGVGWNLWERAERRHRTEAEVRGGLRVVEGLRQQRKWNEAVERAKQARELVRSEAALPALKALVEDLVTDLDFALILDLISTERLARLADRAWTTLSDPEIEARYAQAFRDAGFDARTMSVAEMAEKIRRRGLRSEVAAALDHWTTVRFDTYGKEDPFWKELQALATAVDPDPYRLRLRRAWADFDWEGAHWIMDSPETLDQPMGVLMSLAMPLLMHKRHYWMPIPAHEPHEHLWRELLLKLHARQPDDFWVNYSLSEDYLQEPAKDPAESLRFATAAVALRPDNLGARVLIGDALIDLKRYDEAIAVHKEAVRLNGNSASAHLSLGAALGSKGLWEGAMNQYRESIRLENDYALAHSNLGGVLGRLGRLEEATACFQEAIRLTPGRRGLDNHHLATAYCDLGLSLVLQNRNADAIDAWRSSLRISPDVADVHYNLALILATSPDPALRDPSQALCHAERAASIVPDNSDYQGALGIALYRNGNDASAIEALNRSIKLSKGGDAGDYFFLAMAHWRSGQREEARTHFEKAMKLWNEMETKSGFSTQFHDEAEALMKMSPTLHSESP